MPLFSLLDWLVLGGYLAALAGFGALLSRRASSDARDFFLGGNAMSLWLVTFSVLATTQSAATFLGGPDYGFRGDYTYLSSYAGGFAAALFVAHILIPRFYAIRATTVYELLEARYGRRAARGAGAMYLVGRIFANGARLYMAALAVAMILFANVDAVSVILAALAITGLGFAFTVVGGLRSVIWSDFIQFLVYAGAAIGVLIYLYLLIPADLGGVVGALANAPDGENKLRLIETTFSLSQPFSIPALFTGVFLLYVGNFGLDQDTTQRLLSCESPRAGGRALIISALAAIPLVWVFISIGQLLHIFYERPEIMGAATDGIETAFEGESVTVFMFFILTELPAGLRGLVTAGVVAAAISTLNSGLNSMASVIVEDFYRPWREGRGQKRSGQKRNSKSPSAAHYVIAGRIGMAVCGGLLFAMAALCYFWQRHTDMALLEFALSVMTFAYAGLIGVFAVAVFTNRGSANSVIAGLIAGFVLVLLQQNAFADMIGLPDAWRGAAFPWKLCVGALGAAAVCALGQQRPSADHGGQAHGPTGGHARVD
ncbi:MAG: sodium:solute symporter [Pseudomonadota bacterium]